MVAVSLVLPGKYMYKRMTWKCMFKHFHVLNITVEQKWVRVGTPHPNPLYRIFCHMIVLVSVTQFVAVVCTLTRLVICARSRPQRASACTEKVRLAQGSYNVVPNHYTSRTALLADTNLLRMDFEHLTYPGARYSLTTQHC